MTLTGNSAAKDSAVCRRWRLAGVRSIGAKRCIELGTYTPTLRSPALALPTDGTVIACDVSTEWTAVGQPFWRKAGVADRIDLRIGPGLETLDALLAAGEAGRFDFAFIDADKPNYPLYYERLLKLVRRGGLIAVDNTLWRYRERRSSAMFLWSQRRGVKLHFIQPGKPTQNAFVESFNGKFREYCLDLNWFTSLEDARLRIERWRKHFNHVRPHR